MRIVDRHKREICNTSLLGQRCNEADKSTRCPVASRLLRHGYIVHQYAVRGLRKPQQKRIKLRNVVQAPRMNKGVTRHGAIMD